MMMWCIVYVNEYNAMWTIMVKIYIGFGCSMIYDGASRPRPYVLFGTIGSVFGMPNIIYLIQERDRGVDEIYWMSNKIVHI